VPPVAVLFCMPVPSPPGLDVSWPEEPEPDVS
jgi:hypothetical protein